MLSHLLLSAIVGLSILLMLVRPRGIAEAYWVVGGALLLLALRLISPQLAGRAVAEGADVYLFLIGMMLLSALAREHGVFDWLSSLAVRRADGSAARLFTLVYGIGTLVTIFLSNDATAVVLTPAIFTVVRRANVPPLPYLFSCAMIANAASFTLPISNPANLVVFSQAMPPLGRWLASFSLPSLLSIVATYAALRWLFKTELHARINEIEGETEDETKVETEDETKVETEDAIDLPGNGRLVLAGLGLTVAVLLAASALHRDLGLPTCLAALAITLAVSFKARSNPLRLAKEVSWATLALVAGLFIMVNAVESVGALKFTGAALRWAEGQAPAIGALITSFALGILNNLVNNLPLGLIAGATLQAGHAKGMMASAVLIGVDLGPNLSVTGSLATMLWLIALRQEQLDVSFWKFLKVGAVTMPIAMLAATSGAIVMQLLFAPR